MDRRGLLIVSVAVLLLTSACQAIREEVGSGDAPSDGEEEGRVTMEVAEGPRGNTLLLVPVFIQEDGPFVFALDTGASRSLIDEGLVENLGLSILGETDQPVAGVVEETIALRVEIDEWRLEDVDLPSGEYLALALSEDDEDGLQGLLGSDVLREFGTVTLDYDDGALFLGDR